MMKDKYINPLSILMVDDDDDDCLMTKEALKEVRINSDIAFVKDCEELIDYLQHQGKYSEPDSSPRPNLILLDLNMPKKRGCEVLKEIKSNPELQSIPIIVLTTSKSEEDVLRAYDLGANSFITKPASFEMLVDVMKTLTKYWFDIVKLPQEIKRR